MSAFSRDDLWWKDQSQPVYGSKADNAPMTDKQGKYLLGLHRDLRRDLPEGFWKMSKTQAGGLINYLKTEKLKLDDVEFFTPKAKS